MKCRRECRGRQRRHIAPPQRRHHGRCGLEEQPLLLPLPHAPFPCAEQVSARRSRRPPARRAPRRLRAICAAEGARGRDQARSLPRTDASPHARAPGHRRLGRCRRAAGQATRRRRKAARPPHLRRPACHGGRRCRRHLTRRCVNAPLPSACTACSPAGTPSRPSPGCSRA